MFSLKMTLGLMALHKGGGSSGGGGGSSGKVSWPEYLQTVHKQLLRGDTQADLDDNISIYDALNDAWDNSPYSDAFTYDPTLDIVATQNQFEQFNHQLQMVDPADRYEEYHDLVKGKVDETYSDEYIATLIAAREQQMVAPTMRAVARLAAGARDVNAVMTSAFILGIADIEARGLQEITTSVYNEVGQARLRLLSEGMQQVYQTLYNRVNGEQVAAQLQAEINRVKVVAMKEFIEGDLELSVKDRTWNLELWQPAGNMLAAIQGGTSNPTNVQKDRTSTSTIGGAIGMGSSGAMLGLAVGGPLGAGIGAVLGGGAGALLA